MCLARALSSHGGVRGEPLYGEPRTSATIADKDTSRDGERGAEPDVRRRAGHRCDSCARGFGERGAGPSKGIRVFSAYLSVVVLFVGVSFAELLAVLLSVS